MKENRNKRIKMNKKKIQKERMIEGDDINKKKKWANIDALGAVMKCKQNDDKQTRIQYLHFHF